MRNFLKQIYTQLFGKPIGPFYIGERRGKIVMMSENDFAREAALDVLEKHGIRAQFNGETWADC